MRRRRVWSVDPLEGREHLSVTPILGLIGPPVISTGSTAASGMVHTLDNAGPSQFAITAEVTQARPNELARRRFHATFAGRVVEEAPRLTDQARQFYLLAPGNTNQFLHGTLQMRYYTPEPGSTTTIVTGQDPTTGQNQTLSFPATQTTGTLSMSDRSTQSGGLILADLLGDPTQVDARGRPTRFNLTVNGGGGSGGIYASSAGTGIVRITYRGNVAKVVVDASIFIYGIGQPLATLQSNTHH